MVAFVLRRLVLGVLVLVALSAGSFCFFAWQAEPRGPHPSLLAQYWTWLRGLWGGPSLHVLSQPFSTRTFNRAPVRMTEAFGHSLALLGLTLVIVVVLGVALAVVAASRRGSALDVTLRALSYLAWAVPAFLLCLLVQLFVNWIGGPSGFGPFPIAGWPGSCPAGIGIDAGTITPCPAAGTGGAYVLNVLRYVTLPALTLACGFVGLHARYLRSALIDTLAAPYITTARAKGLRERTVVLRHALRISLVTFVGALLSDFGAMLGAALAVDWIFQLDGLGTVFISLFPVEFGTVDPYAMTPVLVLTALLVVGSSIVGDLAVFWLDPRVRVHE